MKLKELKRTVNMSWSPAEHYPVLIAAGSAAQQVDATFSSNSYLELYSLNLDDPGLDMELKTSLQTQHKFHKIVWSGAGIIIGGCDGGLIEFYNAEKLLKNETDALQGSSTKHNGHISALDINPYQKNLLASGASESEICIWDLNNTSQPMTPGNRSQPYDHVQGLAWNQQVQHILGSTFATRCVVWDLRKNEPIMKLSDSQSRTRWRALSWHPSVATQVCIASEEDQVPVIQLWDLRLAASPLATLEGHHKGVMSLSWCRQDPSLLLSAGKDGRVLLWDPNNTNPGGQLSCEVSARAAWALLAAWSPRAPALLATSSADQLLAVHALLPADTPRLSSQAQSSMLESFGAAPLPPAAAPPAPRPAPAPQPPRAPAWLPRKAAVKFAFGGKLVTVEKISGEGGVTSRVRVAQVVTEPELAQRAAELDAALAAPHDQGGLDRLAEYCRQQGDAATDQDERYTWYFLRANFLPSFRSEFLNLLGYKQDEIPSKFKNPPTVDGAADLTALSRGESTETEAELSTDTSTDLSDGHTLIERKLANIDLDEPTVTNVVIPNGEDSTSLICRALVCGNLEEAVELCLEAKRVADALVIASLGSPQLVQAVQRYHLRAAAHDPVALLAAALRAARWPPLLRAADARSWRPVLAALFTHCDADALPGYCEMLGERLSSLGPGLREAGALCYVCAASADALAARWRAEGRAEGRAEWRARLPHLARLARRAAAVRGRPVQAGGELEQILSEYALQLASQGALHSALCALDGVRGELAARLQHALGLAPHQRRASHQIQQHQQVRAKPHKRAPLGNADISNSYSGGYEQQPWQQASVPAYGHHNSYMPPSMQPHPQPPPQPMQPQPPQPPRPGSVGSQSGGITSRSKYKVDPSVQSAPLYNQYSFNNPPHPPFAGPGYNSPLPDQYGSASVPSSFAPVNPVNSMNPSNVMNPNPMVPLNPMNPLNPANPLNPVTHMNPAVNGAYYNQPEQAPPPLKPVAPGWNDPPMLSSKPKPKPEVSAPQAPITHPIFGVEQPQHVPLTGGPQQYPQQPQQYLQQYGQQTQQYPGQYAQYPDQQYAQYTDQQYAQYPPAQQAGYPPQTEPPAALSPPPKPPLSADDARLQAVLDALRADCLAAAHTPQIKRKLEDIQRRLDILYDMLRENKLSESARACLRECADAAGAGRAADALAAAAALAGAPDFAAVAAFLPGLKALLQLAAQPHVR